MGSIFAHAIGYARAATLPVVAISLLGAAKGVPVSSAPRNSSMPPAAVTLANGVTVSAKCGDTTAPSSHIVFSSGATHQFLGYGVNVEAARATNDIPKTVADIRTLGFTWIKLSFHPPKASAAPVGKSREQTDATVGADVHANLPPPFKALYQALHAAGVKVVNTYFRPPDTFFETTTTPKGKFARIVKPDLIPDFARYYAAYLRSMERDGIRADLTEILNEPNLAQNGKFRPEEYAQFLKDVETELSSSPGQNQSAPLHANLSAPATAARLPKDAHFVEAIAAAGASVGLKAITFHTYYVRDRPPRSGIPPADDPALQRIVGYGRKWGVPVIATEFGGTDVKTKDTHPELESVDTAEELKAALDLVRNGVSAAFVWALYPNERKGHTVYAWALVDNRGPTDAYWPFYILVPKVPVGADVLGVQQTDIVPTMTSLGYAAFQSGNRVIVGLSNPSTMTPVTNVTLGFPRGQNLVVDSVDSFTHSSALGRAVNIETGQCPLMVTLPKGTGAVLQMDARSG